MLAVLMNIAERVDFQLGATWSTTYIVCESSQETSNPRMNYVSLIYLIPGRPHVLQLLQISMAFITELDVFGEASFLVSSGKPTGGGVEVLNWLALGGNVVVLAVIIQVSNVQPKGNQYKKNCRRVFCLRLSMMVEFVVWLER